MKQLDLSNDRNVQWRERILCLLVGGGVGAATALLLAPKEGKQLREDIGTVARRGYDATLETAGNLRSKTYETIDSVRENAANLLDLAGLLPSISESLKHEPVDSEDNRSAGIDRMINESGNIHGGKPSRSVNRRASNIV